MYPTIHRLAACAAMRRSSTFKAVDRWYARFEHAPSRTSLEWQTCTKYLAAHHTCHPEPSQLTEQSTQDSASGGMLRRTVRFAMWASMSTQALAVMSLATSLVVARFISPSELGRYALVSSIVTLVGAASSLQAGGYYIITDNPSARLLRTGLTIELALSSTLWLIVAVGSSIYGVTSGDWGIVALLITASAVLLTNPFNSLRAWFNRNLKNRIPSLTLIVVGVISMAIKIILVVAGFGAWALVIGDVALSAIYGLVMFVSIPDARGFAFDRSLARKQIKFGLPALGIGMLNTGIVRAPDLIIAAMLGASDLGFYFLAARIPMQLNQLLISAGSAMFPAFSRFDKEKLTNAFKQATYFSALVFVVPLAVVIPFAEPIVTTVYGAKWAPSAQPTALLFLITAIGFVTWQYGNLLKSQNQLPKVLRISALQLGLVVVLCAGGASLDGLNGALIGLLLAALGLVTVKFETVRTVIDFHALPAIAPSLIALAVSLVCALGISQLAPTAVAIAVTTVAATIATAIALYITSRAMAIRVIRSILPERHAA